MASAHAIDISDFEHDPRLFLFTSLTAGSSHIITATSRLETILKANKIPFQAIDLATDEKARRLWQRRAGKRKLPGLVKEGFVVGDLDEVEEWNEFGELKESIGPVPAHAGDAASHAVKTGVSTAPPIPINPTATHGTANVSTPVNKAPRPGVDESKFRALPGAAEMAERNRKRDEGKGSVVDENVAPEGMGSAVREKEASITAAKKLAVEERRGVEHLSAPPSGVATPDPEAADNAVAAEKAGEVRAEEDRVTHRGSEVKEADAAEVREVESANSLAEDVEEDSAEKRAAAVEATDAGEGKAAEEVQEQPAKEGGDAGKSVGD